MLEFFKSKIEPNLKGFEIKYKYFEQGDFGSLVQIEFNNELRGGEIDFWSTGWLSIHLVDYIKGEAQINIFLSPNEKSEQEKMLLLLRDSLISSGGDTKEAS